MISEHARTSWSYRFEGKTSSMAAGGRRLLLLALWSAAICPLVAAQSYILETGRPEFRTEVPVEHGFINVANGNLHIELPLVSVPQRGGRQFTAAFVYDSAVWRKVYNAFPQFWALSMNAGWRLQSTASPGGVTYSVIDSACPTGPTGAGRLEYTNFVWGAPDGTKRSFPVAKTWSEQSCYTGFVQSTSSDFSSDRTGYRIDITNFTQATVFAPDGTQVFPVVKDTNGNYFSQEYALAGPSLSYMRPIDTLGRCVYQMTVDSSNNNIRYLDFTTSDGSTARYTITFAPVSVYTAFGENFVTEYQGTLNQIQSIQLPNDQSYVFEYDSGTTPGHYGLLTRITLTTGGSIDYTYSTCVVQAERGRCVSSRTSNGATWTYTRGTGVTETRPDGNETVYFLGGDLNATQADFYAGSSSGGTLLRSISMDYDLQRPIRHTTTLNDVNLVSKVELCLRRFADTQSRVDQRVGLWEWCSRSASAAN